MTRRLVNALDYPAPLSEAAEKLREEVAANIAATDFVIRDALTPPEVCDLADAALAVLGITWEQAARLKSGAKIVEVVDLPHPPINMEPSP